MINGDALTVNDQVTNIADLLKELRLEKKSLIIEHNQVILRKEHHQGTSLSEGDRLEIVHFVGGG
ncbi:sulfur carrier protein ThiS [Gracilibacillus sp. S3-1-1]|uniref:Sulfur carrier protein ThiS n=1 Tax=Gracilibacillus pellucidus TaxID=3095368 RepID=A0ACC6M479_9BACI|nr:sulfur carrier protein ThiS [Gracilibacillus sp. S3-1-1]MDX8045724.1 sulfur carrier protein ThiS [Gracilibacillus sp. S3-1-1]